MWAEEERTSEGNSDVTEHAREVYHDSMDGIDTYISGYRITVFLNLRYF